MGNMDIWDAVQKTDPSHTKKVNQRGGFTAIDAHYQIMKATEQFGPIGIGWGYHTEKLERLDQFVVAHVVIWHGDRENTFGPVLGCAEMFGNRPDSDAPKKATTDAITKGLSQLGFNADVFLGRFDDAKYVQERTAEEQAAKVEPTPGEILEAAYGAETIDALQNVWTANKEWQASPDFQAAKETRKKQLLEQKEAA